MSSVNDLTLLGVKYKLYEHYVVIYGSEVDMRSCRGYLKKNLGFEFSMKKAAPGPVPVESARAYWWSHLNTQMNIAIRSLLSRIDNANPPIIPKGIEFIMEYGSLIIKNILSYSDWNKDQRNYELIQQIRTESGDSISSIIDKFERSKRKTNLILFGSYYPRKIKTSRNVSLPSQKINTIRKIVNLNDIRKGSSASKLLKTFLGEPRGNRYINERSVVTVHFENLEEHLLRYLEKATYIVGCVAWLTNRNILSLLSRKKVSIIIDENIGEVPEYKNLKGTGANFPIIAKIGIDEKIVTGSPPHMHHKFLVLMNDSYIPYAVWTGSFNMTWTATHSLENAVYIESVKIATEYYYEWKILALESRPI